MRQPWTFIGTRVNARRRSADACTGDVPWSRNASRTAHRAASAAPTFAAVARGDRARRRGTFAALVVSVALASTARPESRSAPSGLPQTARARARRRRRRDRPARLPADRRRAVPRSPTTTAAHAATTRASRMHRGSSRDPDQRAPRAGAATAPPPRTSTATRCRCARRPGRRPPARLARSDGEGKRRLDALRAAVRRVQRTPSARLVGAPQRRRVRAAACAIADRRRRRRRHLGRCC